jgi:hypothetical protein
MGGALLGMPNTKISKEHIRGNEIRATRAHVCRQPHCGCSEKLLLSERNSIFLSNQISACLHLEKSRRCDINHNDHSWNWPCATDTLISIRVGGNFFLYFCCEMSPTKKIVGLYHASIWSYLTALTKGSNYWCVWSAMCRAPQQSMDPDSLKLAGHHIYILIGILLAWKYTVTF